MTFNFTPRFKRSSRKAGKVAKNPSFTYRMNEMDETDAYTWNKSENFQWGKRWVFFDEQLDGTDGHDRITINQRAPHADADAMVYFRTDIYAGQGNDIIVHNHQDQDDQSGEGNGESRSRIQAWGGDGRDSFVVNGDHNWFIIKDMEVGETMTVDGKYIRVNQRGSANSDGRTFYNIVDRDGNEKIRVGASIPENTELQFSKGPNNESVFTLVEI